MMRRRWMSGAIPRARRSAVALTLLLALGAAACSESSSDASGNGTTETTASNEPGTAVIESFEVPESVTCPAGEISSSVTVSYAVRDADRQEVRIDGLPVEGTDEAAGTVEADFRCDGLPHDVVLVAYDSEGRHTTDRKQFTTTTG